jgi:bacillolysin
MKKNQVVRGLFAFALMSIVSLNAQPIVPAIPSLTEPGEGLVVRNVSETGLVTFAGGAGRGILLPPQAGTTAAGRALSFVDGYGKAFGLAGSSEVRVVRTSAPDALGVEHVRLQQMHRGVPVRGGELVIHLNGPRVVAANGHTTTDLPANVTPGIGPSAAQLEAQRLIEKHRPQDAVLAAYGEPRLEIFNRGLLSEVGTHRSLLAWFVEVTGPALREFVWVDAERGAILLSFSQLPSAKSRFVNNSNSTSTLPGVLVRSEGDPPTGDTDTDNAYTFAGITYDYYFTNHGRDSYDGAGAVINSTVHYCDPGTCPNYQSAFWNGTRMVYGNGYPADDVVGHELTHAVTAYSANLFYYSQSGALNESFSDIFGETIDLTDAVGNDSSGVRWKIAEEIPGGAIRDMMTPTNFSDPGKMSDSAYFVCSSMAWTDGSADQGGVHSNSGIPNHAYALMVDGGTYNGKTITGIGLTKAAKVQYRSLTVYLTSGSTFADDFSALNQSCTDLIGTAGITGSDCTAVSDALLAVEMAAVWPCTGGTLAPALCPSGIPSFTTFDGFETTSILSAVNAAGGWFVVPFSAKEGSLSALGQDTSAISDHQFVMNSGVTVPAGGRFYIDHMFEFENGSGSSTYDGGVLEYSTNGGSVWNDAAGLIDAGKGYGGTVNSCCGNPLAGRSAFVKSSFGYTGTRLSLASLAGQSVKFRFRIGTDSSVSSLGWYVDNVSFYTCVSSAFTDDPLVVFSTLAKKLHISELRSRIDSVRIRNSLAAYPWTDPVITIGTTKLRAVHITEMRSALAAAYTAAGLTAPVYTDPGLTIGTTVKKAHIAQLRSAVMAME